MPALSDGRLTNYLSRCELNATIMKQFNITSEAQYRAFLQTNPELVSRFIQERFNMVLPYFHTTPCVTSAQFAPY